MSLQIKVLTPLGEKLNREVERATLPGLEGEYGVLESHSPMLTALENGVGSLKTGHVEDVYAFGSGYAEVYEDRITVFVESFEHADDIDMERARESLKRGQERIRSTSEEVEHERLSYSIKRAEVRLEAAGFKN